MQKVPLSTVYGHKVIWITCSVAKVTYRECTPFTRNTRPFAGIVNMQSWGGGGGGCQVSFGLNLELQL